MGEFYYTGTGVDQDFRRAAAWYAKAACNGLAVAQFHMARIHIEGKGVSPDDTEAIKWARKAAAQGHAEGQFILATLMFSKAVEGMPWDMQAVKEAVGWLRKAGPYTYLFIQLDFKELSPAVPQPAEGIPPQSNDARVQLKLSWKHE